MNKAYSRIVWENYPCEQTPLNETNLNKMDSAVNVLDDRIIAMDTSKLDKTTAMTMVKTISFDEATGIFTVTLLNGSSFALDTKMEKLAVNFGYDPDEEQMIIVLDDGTEQRVDMSALITQYEFLDSDTVAFTVIGGKVSASIIEGSVGEKHLQPNYLADIRVESANAAASAEAAASSELNAENSELMAKSYAESCENAKEYVDQKLLLATFDIDDDGNLIYTDNTAYLFTVDDDGYLNWEVA